VRRKAAESKLPARSRSDVGHETGHALRGCADSDDLHRPASSALRMARGLESLPSEVDIALPSIYLQLRIFGGQIHRRFLRAHRCSTYPISRRSIKSSLLVGV